MLRARARGGQAHDGDAPLRRPVDRRHGAPRRRDRRDADRRGQDAHRHPGGRAQFARRPGRPRRDRQRLPRPPRRDVDEADLRRARRHRRGAPEHAALRGQARRLRRRRDVRHELRVRLRLSARQHGHDAGREGPARRAAKARGGQVALPHVRDRRRGRQHPDRRGADAADHLGRPRAGCGAVRAVREAGAADGARQDARGHGPADEEGVRRRFRLRVRGEAQDGLGHRARRRQGRAVPRDRPPLPSRERPPRQPPDPVAEGRVAVQARRRLRGDRRRGQDHRRVHGPHPRGPPLVGGPAPGGRGQGGRARPGGEPDAGDDHAPELLPDVRQARGHDRYGADRGDRVHEDLQPAGRRGPDQPADGPRRTTTTRSTRPRRARPARSPARSSSATPAASPCSSGRSRSRSQSSCRPI